MGRPTKYQKSTQTRHQRVQDDLNNIILPFSNETVKEFLTIEKMEILNHPAKKKVLGGGREAGKTRIAIADTAATMSEDKHASAMSARKYKTLAADKFKTIFINFALEVKHSDYLVPEFKGSQNKILLMRDYKNVNNNSTVECVSFDDPNSISGAEAPNLGYYSHIIIDEPVLHNDTGKTPSRDEWAHSLKMIKRTVDRSNKRHKRIFNKAIPKPTTYVCMNLWDKNHPEVEDLNNHIPDDVFLNFMLGYKNVLSKSRKWREKNISKLWESVQKNTTMTIYNKATDTLYAKMSSFANPFYLDDEETKNEAFKEFKTSIINIDSNALASLLGLTFEGYDDRTNVYDTRRWIAEDTIEKYGQNSGWEVKGISFGWDVDINIELVGTCTIVVQRKDIAKWGIEEKVLVLPQRIIPMDKSIGDHLEANVHSSRIAKATNDLFNIVVTNFKFKPQSRMLGKYFSVDVDDRHWLYYYRQELSHFWDGSIDIAKKHDNNSKPYYSWGINTRIKALQLMLDKDYIVFDKANQRLYNEVIRMTKKLDGTGRDESGYKHRLFNLLNSLEYALFVWRYRPNIIKDGVIPVERE